MFPEAGLAPELSDSSGSVILTIYPGPYPGAFTRAPGSNPGLRVLAPGTVDVCAIYGKGTRTVYGDIPTAGSPVIR